MKLKIALAIALVSSLSPVLASAAQHPETPHNHGTVTLHDRAPHPHVHESQAHH